MPTESKGRDLGCRSAVCDPLRALLVTPYVRKLLTLQTIEHRSCWIGQIQVVRPIGRGHARTGGPGNGWSQAGLLSQAPTRSGLPINRHLRPIHAVG
jgi:hypothetical protein